MLDVADNPAVLDYKGQERGELGVRIVPHTTEAPPMMYFPGSPASPNSDAASSEAADQETSLSQQWTQGLLDDKVDEEDIRTKIDQTIYITVMIQGARGIPQDLSSNVYVAYKWHDDMDYTVTHCCPLKSINPRLDFVHTFPVLVTQQLCDYFEKEVVDFQVHAS